MKMRVSTVALAAGALMMFSGYGCGSSDGGGGAGGAHDTGGLDAGRTVGSGGAGLGGRDGAAGGAGGTGSAMDAALIEAGGNPGLDASKTGDLGGIDANLADVAIDGGRSIDVPAIIDSLTKSETAVLDQQSGDGMRPDGRVVMDASNLPTTTPNLIVNGDAEAAGGSMDGSPVKVPSWTSAGEATATKWGASEGFPSATDPGPADRGKNFFCGGYQDPVSTLTQKVGLEKYAPSIDGGAVMFTLDGYLGGNADQDDNAVLAVSFRDSTDVELGKSSIGPVSASDRTSVTGLLHRSATGSVPVGARSAVVTLSMTRAAGTANDGYADNLSLILGNL